MGTCVNDCFPTADNIHPELPDSCEADDCFSAAINQGKSALGWLWCASLSLCLMVNHSVACAYCVCLFLLSASDKNTASEFDNDPEYDPCFDDGNEECFPEPVGKHHTCGIIFYAMIFIVALPLLICFALLALVYLLIGCCLSCCNKGNQVHPVASTPCDETSMDLQSIDSTHHM